MHFVSIGYVGAAIRNLRELFSFQRTLIVLIILFTFPRKKNLKIILTISNVFKMFLNLLENLYVKSVCVFLKINHSK